MLNYEVLLLSIPAITGDESKKLEFQLNRLIQKEKGSMFLFDRWGKFKLAYPVRRNDYGVYFLARFEIPEGTSIIDDIKTLFKLKLNNIIMREMFSRLDPDQPLEYQRPKSLEEATTRDVETFLKENKMEGLLSSVDSTEAPKEKDKETEKQPKELSEIKKEG